VSLVLIFAVVIVVSSDDEQPGDAVVGTFIFLVTAGVSWRLIPGFSRLTKPNRSHNDKGGRVLLAERSHRKAVLRRARSGCRGSAHSFLEFSPPSRHPKRKVILPAYQ
jgi:hypothetical protein